MAKRKRQNRRVSPFRISSLWQRQPTTKLEVVFEQADSLINAGRAQEAIALLEPYLSAHPKEAELHYYIGYAHAQAGDIWGALTGHEWALDLSGDAKYWLPLSSLYLQLEMNAHALQAFRQVIKHRLAAPNMEDAQNIVNSLEQDVAEAARQVDIPVAQMEKGLRHLEQGQRALNSGDYSGCIAANQKAINLLKNWPPPRNNLSLALFFDGKPEEALTVARQVLTDDPGNLQALSNAIRFFAWSNREPEARELWTRLQSITTRDDTECLKKAEAAAILGEDEAVHALLKPLEKSVLSTADAPGMAQKAQLFLAIAEANTNRHQSAKRRLKLLRSDWPRAKELLSLLQEKKSGPGYAGRYPYFHSTEMIPRERLEEFVKLGQRQDKIPPQKYRREMVDFAARFPQIVLMAEKFIWEEGAPEAGIFLLETLGTPAAFEALRRFGLSQAGDDEIRMEALFGLSRTGQVAPGETFRVWNEGEWREVQLRQIELSDEPDVYYSPEVVELMNQALRLLEKQKLDQAEKLLKRVLKLEPEAVEAYNNLGIVYARRQEHERAKEMYRTAIDIDPTYVFPRTNLALYLLDDDDVDAAEAMLAPLADETSFQPQEMAVYNYVRAQILAYRDEFDAARTSLEIALDIWPDYEAAQEMLENLEVISDLTAGWNSYMERRHQQELARRTRRQGKLATPDPSLSEALSLYSKDVLTGMGRVIIPGGGWSALRKAELLARIVQELSDEDNLARLVTGLADTERKALRQILADGGTMDWNTFEDRYDSDLEESPYWQYHVPETMMGRLRLRGLIVEVTVNKQLLIAIPSDLRPALSEILELV